MYSVCWLILMVIAKLGTAGTSSLSNHSAISSDLFDYHFAAIPHVTPRCDGRAYGSNLDRISCFDAWRSLWVGLQRISWGRRGASVYYDMKLPYRWSSGKYSDTSFGS